MGEKRAYIFNAGPAVLPVEVLKKASESVLDFNNMGMSLVEMSHRSKEFTAINDNAIKGTKELLGVGDDYEVILLQGGASLQFVMIALNFLGEGQVGNYVDTGTWSSKALKEASVIGKIDIVASSKDKSYTYIPKNIPDKPSAYLHVTSNNTIEGTQFFNYPKSTNAPLICDMSSDFLSREVKANDFDMIYAGAQKNAGPSGVTVVVIKKSFLEKAKEKTVYLNYKSHAKETSLYNTPCTFAVYTVGEVVNWIRNKGGLKAIQEHNEKKALILYDCIENSNGFYRSPVAVEDRSLMNIPYRLPSEALEEKFLKEASSKKMFGLKGHRSVGGIRASLYNYLPMESVEALVDFMEVFRKQNS